MMVWNKCIYKVKEFLSLDFFLFVYLHFSRWWVWPWGTNVENRWILASFTSPGHIWCLPFPGSQKSRWHSYVQSRTPWLLPWLSSCKLWSVTIQLQGSKHIWSPPCPGCPAAVCPDPPASSGGLQSFRAHGKANCCVVALCNPSPNPTCNHKSLSNSVLLCHISWCESSFRLKVDNHDTPLYPGWKRMANDANTMGPTFTLVTLGQGSCRTSGQPAMPWWNLSQSKLTLSTYCWINS